MSMYVSGGGSGSGTSTVSGSSSNNVSMFTTPNVANTMYIISITWAPYGISTTTIGGAYCLTPGAFGVVSAASPGSDTSLTAPVAGGGPNVLKVGPNVAVIISFSSVNQVSVGVAWSYNYVSIIMDTN